MEILILLGIFIGGGVMYWIYTSGRDAGYSEGIITGGKLPALGKLAEFQQNPEKYMRNSRDRNEHESSKDVVAFFTKNGESGMPWNEFVSRYNAALRREGRNAEQIEAIPKEALEIPKILQSTGLLDSSEEDIFPSNQDEHVLKNKSRERPQGQ